MRNDLLVALRKARGWTQEDLVRELTSALDVLGERQASPDVRLIKAWESGEVRWPQSHYRCALGHLFVVDSGEALGFVRPGAEPRRHPRVLVAVVDFDTKEDAVQRAKFLKGLAAVAFGMTTGEGVQSWLGMDASRSAGSRAIGTNDIAEIETATAHFANWENTHGGALSLDAVMGQLNWASTLLDKGRFANDRIRALMCRAVANLAEVAGWSAHDAGMQSDARRALMLGMHAAAEGGDWPLRAGILADLARQAVALGRPDDALKMLSVAKYGAKDTATPAAVAMLSVVAGRAHGAKGDVDAVRNDIARADHIYEPPAADDPQWIQYYIPAQLAGDSGHALYAAAEHDPSLRAETAHRLTTASESYGSGYTRSAAFCLARLAVIRFDEREPDEAVRVGHDLLRVGAGIGSARLEDDYRLMRAHAEPYDTSAVSDLLHALPDSST